MFHPSFFFLSWPGEGTRLCQSELVSCLRVPEVASEAIVSVAGQLGLRGVQLGVPGKLAVAVLAEAGLKGRGFHTAWTDIL